MSTATTTVIDATNRQSMVARVVRVFRHRELLLNLVRKELRSRYKDSVLGFVWSLLNPIFYVVIFWLIFTVIMPNGIPDFAAFILAGLLPWTLFASGLSSATSSVVGNGNLLKKVYFPREVLPLSSVGAALFHFSLQMLVLVAYLAMIRAPVLSSNLALVVPAIVVEILLLSGLALLLSALNVYLRDVSHFLELALLAWFWFTPVVYQVAVVQERAAKWLGLYLLNPMAPVVMSFQRAFYNMTTPVGENGPVRVLLDAPVTWYWKHLLATGILGLIALVVGLAVFGRAEANFAEEL